MRVEIEGLRFLHQFLLRRILWEHRLGIVLESVVVQPGTKQHLHGAAAKPVSLLVVRSHATHACPEALGNEGGQRFVAARCNRKLPLRGRRATDQPYLVRRPRQIAQPIQSVIGISQRGTQNLVVAFGKIPPALVHLHIGVAALHRLQRSRHVPRSAQRYVPVVEVVRRPRKDDGILLRFVLRAVDVGLHPLTIPHRHHHLALDDRNRLEFFLGRLPPRNQRRILWPGPLRPQSRHRSQRTKRRQYAYSSSLPSYCSPHRILAHKVPALEM